MDNIDAADLDQDSIDIFKREAIHKQRMGRDDLESRYLFEKYAAGFRKNGTMFFRTMV